MIHLRFLFILLFSVAVLQAQDYRHEAGLWTGVQLNLDLPKNFSFSTQYQLRLDNDLYRVRGSYISGALQYDILKKYLSAEVEYRYRTSRWGDQHRFGIGLTGKYKYKKVSFSLRTVYQRGHEYFNSSYEPGHEPTNYLRNRFQVKLDLKKRFELFASGEPYVRFSNKYNGVDRFRSIAGVGWEFVKTHHLQVFYLHQFTIGRRNPAMQHNTGISYSWDVPKFWKKPKKKDAKK
ncbi:MAG: DUF2490 domain-containing protein [Bacteroidetes bacterium]|nr:DUF2490 domain-containing protein [Bacteroidota bacterium]